MVSNVNRLIALGGRGVSSPVERFIATKGEMERGRLRNVQEQAGYQNMDATRLGMESTQQTMDIRQQQQKVKGLASVGKYLEQFPGNEAVQFEKIKGSMDQFGLPAVPPNVTYEQVKPAIDQSKLEIYGEGEAPVKRTMPAGTNARGQNMVVDRLYDGGKLIEESKPYVKKEITREAQVDAADYGGIGKTGQGVIDKKAIGALGLRDSLTSLGSMMDENKDEYTLTAGLNAWAGNTAQFLGADISDQWQKEITTRQTLDGKTRSAETMIRIATTGMAASARELDEHIRPRVRQKGDAYTKARAKLDALIEFEELTTVRMNMLRNQGFQFSTVGEGDDVQLMATKDGVSRPIQQVSPLKAVSPYDDRKNEVLTSLLKGRDPNNVPREEIIQLMNQTLDMLEIEGYNVKARRK